MNAKLPKPPFAVDIRDEEDPFGGVPVNTLDSEGVFLSACLLQPEKFSGLAVMLRPEQFYSTANQHIFEAILAVNDEQGGKHDLVLVANWMRSHGTLKSSGGTPYLATLCDTQPATAQPAIHATEIREAWKRRELMICMRRLAVLMRNGEASHSDCYDELKEHFRKMKE